MIISFVIGLMSVGCTDNKQTKVDSIGSPYTIKIDDLEKNILGEEWDRIKSNPELSMVKHFWYHLGSLGYNIAQEKSFDEIINTFVVVVPVQISNHDVEVRSTLELRECSFKGDISET